MYQRVATKARRMCEVAAHLTDKVLPHVPARQWVLSVPKRLRPYLHHDVRVAGAVLQIFLRAIRTTLRRSSPGAPPRAQLGAVSFFHRFGSSLNVHPHYHLVVLDGVFSKADDREIAFHEAYDLTPDRIAQVESVVRKRVLRYCARPPFALERLHALGSTPSLASPESRLVYRFPKPDIHGRTELLRTPLKLLEDLNLFYRSESSSLDLTVGGDVAAHAVIERCAIDALTRIGANNIHVRAIAESCSALTKS